MNEFTFPHDDGAEAAVLGAMLLNGADCDLRPDEFYSLTNQKVYGAIRSLREAGSPVDAVTVNSELMQRGMEDAGATIAGLRTTEDGVNISSKAGVVTGFHAGPPGEAVGVCPPVRNRPRTLERPAAVCELT